MILEYNYESFQVKTKKLDELVKKDNIGFIKIDVEGHETEVIRGSIELIKRNKPTLLVEIEERHTKKPIESTINFIKKLGYECFQLKENKVKLFNIKEHISKDNNFLFIKKSLIFCLPDIPNGLKVSPSFQTLKCNFLFFILL